PVRLAADADRLHDLVAPRADAADRSRAFVRDPHRAAAESKGVRRGAAADPGLPPLRGSLHARHAVAVTRADPDTPSAVGEAERAVGDGHAPDDSAGDGVDADHA